ncbi:SHOCT domain-containing protein [Nocardia sp. NPDC004568]|uniref:SHOCT domain-containing protein n=1 Tax=Nocardia sp. NPDC004568 TaxID=3154551 RepID=UPI0033B22365
MVFRGARVGRPGLLGTVARTAVVAGTARATANAVDRHAQRRAAESQAYYDEQQSPPPTTVAPPESDSRDLVSKLQQLGQLHADGALTDTEFAEAKQQLLH